MSIVSECTLRLEILHNVANNLGLLERAFSKIFLVVYLLSKSVNPYSRAGNGDCGLLLLPGCPLYISWDWSLSFFFFLLLFGLHLLWGGLQPYKLGMSGGRLSSIFVHTCQECNLCNLELGGGSWEMLAACLFKWDSEIVYLLSRGWGKDGLLSLIAHA